MKFIDNEDLLDDTQKIYNVLNDETDLACVLIGTSYLSELLANIIEINFINTSISGKLLDPQGGAIRQFSTKADLAYCLGLIKKNIYQDLKIVAEIRNKFAHKHLVLDFSDKVIITKCQKLQVGHEQLKKIDKEELSELLPGQMGVLARNQFTLSVVMIGQRMHVDILSKKNTAN